MTDRIPALVTHRASGLRPCAAAADAVISTTAAAPSLSVDALPAVTVPPSRCTDGGGGVVVKGLSIGRVKARRWIIFRASRVIKLMILSFVNKKVA